jgi:integrase
MPAVVVEPHDRKHLFKVTEACSEMPARDLALLGILFGSPMKVTEIAQLKVRHVLSASGDYLHESEIPAEIAFNGLSRPWYWSSKPLRALLDCYFMERVKRNQGLSANPAAFRQLDPDSSVFLNRRGEPFHLAGRKDKAGQLRYTCTSLSRHYSSLFAKAGIEGATAESGRRTFAVTLRRQGYDIPHIHALLGNQDLKTTRRMLDSDPVDMGAIAAKAF